MWFRRPGAAVLVALSVAFGGCKRVEEPVGVQRPAPTASSATVPAAPAPPPLLTPSQVLTLPSSAYQASIFADDEAFEILTSSGAYRLLPGKEPVERVLDLGFAATVTRQSYVYWSRGAIWSESRREPKPSGPTKLLALAEQPQRIVADIAADEFVFLTHSADHHYAIGKRENGRAKTLYAAPGSIDALTLIGDSLYFVERPGGMGWRIARVRLSSGEATFTASKTGRWPALLRGAKELVYYDGARRDVLSLSLDLQQEHTLAKDFICSPLAVGANVYCSTMKGIFSLTPTGKPRQLVAAPRQLITNLAVNSQRLAFISDAGAQGQDRLTVNVLPLSEASEAPR